MTVFPRSVEVGHTHVTGDICAIQERIHGHHDDAFLLGFSNRPQDRLTFYGVNDDGVRTTSDTVFDLRHLLLRVRLWILHDHLRALSLCLTLSPIHAGMEKGDLKAKSDEADRH